MSRIWFAVDRDGHVASFQAGANGAVPVSAPAFEDPSELLRQIGSFAEPSGVIWDMAGRILPGVPESAHREAGEGQAIRSVVAFFEVGPPAGAPEGRALPTGRGSAFAYETLSGGEYKAIHKRGGCRGCFWFRGDPPPAVASGLFAFEHLTDGRMPGPYGRFWVPAAPLRLDRLPDALRRKVDGMSFASICFAETPYIQPVEHAECEAPTGTYLALDGRTVRPIPGHEDEYLDEIGSEAGDPGPTRSLRGSRAGIWIWVIAATCIAGAAAWWWLCGW